MRPTIAESAGLIRLQRQEQGWQYRGLVTLRIRYLLCSPGRLDGPVGFAIRRHRCGRARRAACGSPRRSRSATCTQGAGWPGTRLPVAAEARKHSATAFLDITKAALTGDLNSVTSS
jgi:hypothetical protein